MSGNEVINITYEDKIFIEDLPALIQRLKDNNRKLWLAPAAELSGWYFVSGNSDNINLWTLDPSSMGCSWTPVGSCGIKKVYE